MSLCQGRSQLHSPGWARVPLSSFFPQILINFSYFFLKLYLFFLILALRVGESPTREGPGYAIALVFAMFILSGDKLMTFGTCVSGNVMVLNLEQSCDHLNASAFNYLLLARLSQHNYRCISYVWFWYLKEMFSQLLVNATKTQCS